MTPIDDLALLGRVKEIYERALAIVRKLVDAGRKADAAGALSGIEDVLDTLAAHPRNHDGVNETLADLQKFDETLQKFDEALSGNDAAADRVLRDKFGGVDHD